MVNRLSDSTSPYLLQHADNPVDWWEWSEAAFDEARRRDVPIFLSIGYSACHWCHVMAHESFEDQAIADYLNANFVSIKVDREERPDIDSVYMGVTVAMTGHGGWPMTVILDHEAHPFYAGTYFPPTPRHGLPSFPQLLSAVTDSWAQRRDEVLAAGQRIITAINERTMPMQDDGPPTAADLRAAVAATEREFDSAHGGFGGAPKFPPSMLLEFLLREAARTDDAFALAMAERTLSAMARGGLFDQLGGGFARYSVDANWVVPHFEKMLYDNALLLRVYAHWWRLTGSALAERVVRQTAEFLLREMTTPEGAFASALDADSEGVEGLFYAWSPQQLIEVLGVEDGEWATGLLAVTESGTFEHGLSTLQLIDEPEDLPRWERVRSALLAARAKRVRPGRDDKVVAAWNGLAIAALAEAGALFAEPEWIEAALAAADLLLAVHLGAHDDDRLCRTSRDGRAGNNNGVLDDYGSVAEGFLVLYQVTGADEWLVLAGMLLDIAIQHFGDGDGGFFDTADDAPSLVRRPRDASDNAEPSGWFATANACITFAALTGLGEYRAIAERALGAAKVLALRSPRAAGWGLAGASALLAGPLEIAIIGTPSDPTAAALHQVALMSVSPGAVTALSVSGELSSVPLLRERPPLGELATAYVCRGFTCQRPTTSAVELAKQVASNSD